MVDERDGPERLARIAESLGIPQARRHIFLCCDQTKPKCCEKEGRTSPEALAYFFGTKFSAAEFMQ